jgi:hypothetical protein
VEVVTERSAGADAPSTSTSGSLLAVSPGTAQAPSTSGSLLTAQAPSTSGSAEQLAYAALQAKGAAQGHRPTVQILSASFMGGAYLVRCARG